MTEWIRENPSSFAMLDNFDTRSFYSDYVQCETLDIPQDYFHVQYAMSLTKHSLYYSAFAYHTIAIKVRKSKGEETNKTHMSM